MYKYQFNPGDKVGVSVRGIVRGGPATFIAETTPNITGHLMYDLQWHENNPCIVSVIYHDVFPWADFVKVNEPVPPHIRIQGVNHKKRTDQLVRDTFDSVGLDAEPGSIADMLRAFLGAPAPKGCGRLSATDHGLTWVKRPIKASCSH